MFVLTAFTLTALDYRSTGGSSAFDAVRRGSDTVFGPAQRALGGAAHSVGSFFGGIAHVGRQRDEIAKLRDDNDRLRARLRETDSLRRQVSEWNALLGLKDAGGYSLQAAHVISVGSSLGFEWTATIDAGSRDGVRENATVVSGKGLVGRVKRVGPYTSTVLLLVDGDFSVGVRLIRSGQLGLVTGHGVGDLTYQLIGQRARAEVGEAMYTSGSTFAAGIPVGRVSTTSNDPNSPTLTGSLTPYVDVTSLELVGVVLDGPRRTPRVPLRPTPVPSPRPSPTAMPSPSPSPSRSR
ncbi:MAG: rod shape-determining protein MreC [Actinomycetota bacterium]|jgi:rod shape-determining protein MreC|nr:rod shape-determining protein MreC [Actinomycetota bacterium]